MTARLGERKAHHDPAHDAQEQETVAALKALGHPIRYRIMQILTGSDLSRFHDNPCCPPDVVCVDRLLTAIDISPPALSHHLKVLKKAGLVDARRSGIWLYYYVREDTLARVVVCLEGLSRTAPGRWASETSPGAESG